MKAKKLQPLDSNCYPHPFPSTFFFKSHRNRFVSEFAKLFCLAISAIVGPTMLGVECAHCAPYDVWPSSLTNIVDIRARQWLLGLDLQVSAGRPVVRPDRAQQSA